MTAWTTDELGRLGGAEELRIAAFRRDGSLRKPVTVWVVRQGESLYVRSVRGRQGAWFRGVQETHRGRIRAGRIEKDVSFVDARHDIDGEVDATYRAKYSRYTGRILDSILTPEARSTTIELVPRPTS
jgi:hypothetical protein